MTVRSLKSRDISNLTRLYCDVFAEKPWLEKFDPNAVKADFERYLKWPETVFLVAEMDGGGVVGAAVGFDIVRKPSVRELLVEKERAGVFYLAELFVQKGLRKRGFARTLIQERFSRAAQQGYSEVVTRTSINQPIVLNLYSYLGFKRVAEQEVMSEKDINGREVLMPDTRIVLRGTNPY